MKEVSARYLVPVALLALSLSCAKQTQEPEPPSAELSAYVLPALPKDVGHETFIDFGGKLHLVGYDIQPEGVASPGTKVKLTMYWRSHQPLGPGWQLFTHLDAPWLPSENLDDKGPLRKLVQGPDGEQTQVLGPSRWQPGRIYKDEIEFEIPKNVDSPEVTVVAGVWRRPLPEERKAETAAGDEGKEQSEAELTRPSLRLQVLSGPSDGADRGIVTHIRTGRTGRPLSAASGGSEPRRR